MSWYDDAANEVGVAILAKDGPIVGPREVAAIIAKHDPNRWRMGADLTPGLNVPVEFIDDEREVHVGVLWYRGNGILLWREGEEEFQSVTHWREIVLPEVEG